MIDLNRIYNEDCLGGKGMALIPDQSIDMILCDLPYGITGNRDSWDKILPIDQLWAQYKRIIKPTGAIVLTAVNPYASLLVVSNLEMYKYEWIWWKEDCTSNFASVKHQPFRKHEQCLVFSFGKITYSKNAGYMEYYPQMESGKPYVMKRKNQKPTQNLAVADGYLLAELTVNNGERYPGTIVRFNREVGFHPTQKPVGLFEYFIKTYTNEGDTVLDNCVGSGTTCVAAVNTDRNFIAFEWNKKNPTEHYTKAVNRTMNEIMKQGKQESYANLLKSA